MTNYAQTDMILTTCAVCAKPIEHDDASWRCVGCQTRYCSERCERYDRRRGGHTISVGNLTEILIAAREFEEAQSLAREKLPEIIDRHGPDDILTLEVRTWYARALFLEGEDLSEAENVLEDVWRRSKRVLSDSHPDTERARKFLEDVRSARADAAEES